MDNKINFSIIIPSRNVTDLLRRCLDSIPHRDDVQIIVVDDNSDPGIVDIEHYPGLNEPCTEVIFTKEGKGAGYARNCGLKAAKGKWIIFSDSDDYFNYCIDEIFNEYRDTDYDCIFFNATVLDSRSYSPMKTPQRPALYYDKYKNSYQLEHYLRFYFGQPWCKMVKRDVIVSNNIQFEETIIHNDTQYAYLVGFYSKNIKVDDRCIYSYMVRQNSVSKQKWDYTILMTRLKVFAKKYVFLKHHSIDYKMEVHIPNVLLYYKEHDKTILTECYNVLQQIGVENIEIKKAICNRKWETSFVGKLCSFIKNKINR